MSLTTSGATAQKPTVLFSKANEYFSCLCFG